MTIESDSTKLEEQIKRSDRVAKWIRASGRKVRAREAVRSVFTFAAIQLAMEHQSAMVCLAKEKHYASLLALARSVYEAYLWAAWTLRVATDAQLLLLAQDKLSPGLEDMVRALDKQKFFDEPMLKHMKPIIDRMNGYTHGGFAHLQHRIKKESVAPDYPSDLIVDALQMADLFAVMALLEGPVINEDIELGDRLFTEGMELLNLSKAPE